MRTTNKLLALLLAAVMVLGMLPGVTARAETYHTHGIEEYPEIELGVETVAEITESNGYAYFRFTPETTASYTFLSLSDNNNDAQGYLFDSEMNELAHHFDNSSLDFNFTLTYTMEAGVTYVLGAKFYNTYRIGSFNVLLKPEHNYVGEVTTEATCTEDGVMTYTCTDCGDSYTEVIPAGHDYVDGYCTRCGEEYSITGVCGDNLTWKLNGSGTLTISGTGAMYDFSLYYDPLVPWKDYADQIKTVVVEEGATSVGSFAFMDCANLTSVTLPDTVVSIGDSAFRGCSALTDVTLGNGLVTLGGHAFRDCYSLSAITLPEGLYSIGGSAFSGCSALASVNLPEGLAEIGMFAFFNCTGLTEITMPDTVETIGSDLFNGCTGLTKVKLSAKLSVVPDYTFHGCASLVDVTLPTYLATIGNHAFHGCSSLETVALPVSVTGIYDYAFAFCTSLKEIKLPMALYYVGYFAFDGCSSLDGVEFPPNLTYYTGGMFYDCASLSAVTFPEGTTYIDDDTFAGCTGLTTIVFTGDLPTIAGAFVDVVADAYYPAGNTTWTEDVLLDYGGTLTWHAMCEDHTYGKWTPVVPATCTESGVEERECADCGWTETRVSEPKGHIWDEGTADENGEVIYTCLVCGEKSNEAPEKPFVNPFVDVPEDSFYFDPVMWAVEKGITTGTDETHFNPNGECQRAAVVTFLWRAAGQPEPTGANNPFVDVKEGDFYYKAVLWAVENGITNGTSATTFSPMDACNRAQVVTFLWRAMGEPAPTVTGHPFTDVDESMFYMDAMLWAVETGVTTGLTETAFGPLETCNRAQIVTFLYRAYND